MGEDRKDPIRVNGEEVGEALVQQELQMLRERYSREMDPAEMERKRAKIESDARENAVERLLLLQKARSEIKTVRPEETVARFMGLQQQHGGAGEFHRRFGLTREDEAKVKAELEDGIRLEKYFDLICRSVPRPTEADVQAYYEAHKDGFMDPEMVHAAHIVQCPGPGNPIERVYTELLNIRERLMSGEDFVALAAEYSYCRDGSQDLGWFARGQMVPSFENVAFATPAGKISDVFQTEFGYHVLKVYDRKPGRQQEFKEVRYDIEIMLFEERKNAAIGAVADELRSAADIRNLEIVEG